LYSTWQWHCIGCASTFESIFLTSRRRHSRVSDFLSCGSCEPRQPAHSTLDTAIADCSVKPERRLPNVDSSHPAFIVAGPEWCPRACLGHSIPSGVKTAALCRAGCGRATLPVRIADDRPMTHGLKRPDDSAKKDRALLWHRRCNTLSANAGKATRNGQNCIRSHVSMVHHGTASLA